MGAVVGGAAAGPALASSQPPEPAGGTIAQSRAPAGSAGNPAKPNDATQDHTGYLKSRAAGDHMGSSLGYHRSTTAPSTASIPGLAKAPSSSAVRGLDVSSYQPNVNWTQVAGSGGQFAYIKATEGTYYTNPYFASQYSGSHKAGLVRGAYEFAIPSYSSGSAQADYLIANGGGWSAGTYTLPAALDIEYNPYGPECYGLSQSSMVSWVGSFLTEYHAKTGKWPAIYSTTDWWTTCTGNYSGFAGNDPLWIARYASSAGTLAAGWGYYTFWQYADSGTFPGDQDVFNGTAAQLAVLANNK
jgi:GH25 family lysozyme M1 (1,4-beta-N-acetylmuramidase)